MCVYVTYVCIYAGPGQGRQGVKGGVHRDAQRHPPVRQERQVPGDVHRSAGRSCRRPLASRGRRRHLGGSQDYRGIPICWYPYEYLYCTTHLRGSHHHRGPRSRVLSLSRSLSLALSLSLLRARALSLSLSPSILVLEGVWQSTVFITRSNSIENAF